MDVNAERLTTFGRKLIDRYLQQASKCLGKNLLNVDGSEHLHVHIMMMNEAHKLMSLTYCTYLFLCVTMSHLCTEGNKTPLLMPRNPLHGYTESEIMP